MMTQTVSRQDALRALRDLIQDIRIGMLTTLTAEGRLHSRPMATQEMAPDGGLWFFTRANTDKAEEIQANPNVNVSYASPRENHYVSVSGTAVLVRDRKKIEQLWNQLYAAWFPQGLEDPDLALLKVTVQHAEYWDAPSGTMAEIAGLWEASLTYR